MCLIAGFMVDHLGLRFSIRVFLALCCIGQSLFALGPMREDRLTLTLLAVQGACSLLALLARYQLPGLFYDIVK